MAHAAGIARIQQAVELIRLVDAFAEQDYLLRRIDARKEGEHAGNPGLCGADHDAALVNKTEVLRRKTLRVIFLCGNFADSEEEFEAGAAGAEEGFQKRIIREQALGQHAEGIG